MTSQNLSIRAGEREDGRKSPFAQKTTKRGERERRRVHSGAEVSRWVGGKSIRNLLTPDVVQGKNRLA